MGRAVIMAIAVLLAAHPARAQTEANLVALRGLAPAGRLATTTPGLEALAANLVITGAIQAGTLRLPTLLPFEKQQQLAVRDAFITSGNATEYADALGTRLGEAYRRRAEYDDPRHFTVVGPAVTALLAATNAVTASDSNLAKYGFANRTTNGQTPLSAAATAVLDAQGGVADVFGRAYGHPGGSPGADAFGNARPFQTLPQLAPITGPDYFGLPSDNAAQLRGPSQDLVDSPAFPSGHTTVGTMESTLLAILVPERYREEITRGAEYGNDRIILGAHYAMDVIAGRTLALHDVAQLLAKDEYRAMVAAARAELTPVLVAGCGDTVAACAAQDDSRFHDPAANAALVAATLTYGLPIVYPESAATEDVARLAPEAGYLLTAAFPYLSLQQADDILTATEAPGGGFLDDGSAFGVYSRLNLSLAAERAAALAPKP